MTRGAVYSRPMEEQKSTESDEQVLEWLQELTDAAIITTGSPRHQDESLPAIERERAAREPLVSRRVLVGVASSVGVLIALVVLLALMSMSSTLTAPSVVGLDLDLARTQLARENLTLEVVSERFSGQPAGQILEQDPPAGADLKRGVALKVVVSGGTEEFPMPDVIGDGISLARGLLEARGLVVEAESVISEQASDTVLMTTPAAGLLVRTGDTVRVQVSAPRDTDTGLQPYRLDGITVRIDPAPSGGAQTDVTLEVGRRLRALLEASGASISMLRSTNTSETEARRSATAAESSATISIGLDVALQGPEGRIVSSPPSMTAPIGPASEALAEVIEARLAVSAPPVSRVYSTSDPVFSATREPWVRVTVGSSAQRTDSTAFSDPRWADSIARAIYSALGEVYGQRVEP